MPLPELPFVSCLMITGKTPHHYKLAQRAIVCYLQQTYLSKELVIINTGKPLFNSGGYASLSSLEEAKKINISALQTIREIHVKQEKQTLGELRNISMKEAKGDLLLQWDDDDWYSPERITFQVTNFVPGKINILSRQYRLNLLNGNWGLVDASGWPMGGIVGTMLHERTSQEYPPLSKGEDSAFIRQFHVHCQDNPPEIYVRMYHGNNTWDKAKIMQPANGKGHKKGDTLLISNLLTLYAQP